MASLNYATKTERRIMSDKKLKPCPFCGGETKIDNRGEYCYGIVCISCGAKSPDFQTETNAIKSWNDYANDLLKTEQIEPEISLDGIHPDLINRLLEPKRNYPELKPCPFCNGKAKVEESKFGFNHISCESCGAMITAFYMGDLIKAWNRRVEDECCEKSCKEEK